jgi:hypothetical protein
MSSNLDTKILPTAGGFLINPDVSSGLEVHVMGGVILHPSRGYVNAPVVRLALVASAENYVEVNDAGVISANATAFTAGYTPLYVVTTSATIVTGVEDHRGGARPFRTQAMTANGAILETSDFVTLSKSGVLAATIAAPRAGRLLVIQQIDAGTDGHTVTLTAGTFDETATIATFNADNEMLVLYGVSATRFVVIENIGAVALSGP